jgi:hypothetical protein
MNQAGQARGVPDFFTGEVVHSHTAALSCHSDLAALRMPGNRETDQSPEEPRCAARAQEAEHRAGEAHVIVQLFGRSGCFRRGHSFSVGTMSVSSGLVVCS